jgi:2-keto-3-deoxy-L-fuconate dehydrogenase
MGDRLSGKICLVTGAGQGIGRAIADAFAGQGALVWATDLDPAKLDGFPGRIMRLDVRDQRSIDAAANAAGQVEVLVNCAGLVLNGTAIECTDEDWDSSMAINARGMFRMARAFLPGMLERRRGSIINIASTQSALGGSRHRLAYSASKGAVLGLTKSIATDYAAHGIRCNAICPGAVESPSWQERTAASADPAATRAAAIASHPIGRLGTPEDIAGMAVYLASDESRFATGAFMVIDGGGTL